MSEHKDDPKYIQAYRLYMLEEWKAGRIKIDETNWDPSWGSFDLTRRTHINAVIEAVTSKETDKGGNLALIFSGRKKSFKHGPLSRFARMIELLDYESFFDDKVLRDKYVDKADEMGITSKYKGPTGFYFILSTSALKRGAVQYPLYIHGDGYVEIKTKKGLVYGNAKMYKSNEYVYIDFFASYDDKVGAFMGSFLFYSNNISEGLATGVSMRINSLSHPQAKREFLIPFKKIVTATNGVDQYEEFKNYDFCNFYYNDELCEEIKKIHPAIHSLLGRHSNLIEQTIDTLNSKKSFYREEFDRLFFTQSVMEFLKAGQMSRTADDLFRLSLEHGLFLTGRYQHCLKEFCTTLHLPESQIAEIEKAFSSLYQELEMEYKHNNVVTEAKV